MGRKNEMESFSLSGDNFIKESHTVLRDKRESNNDNECH